MSQLLINRYLNKLHDLKSIKTKETTVRDAFKSLLTEWGEQCNLTFTSEFPVGRLSVDGALLNSFHIPFGYWEAKDQEDDLDAKIKEKFRAGYPQDNIIFDDSQTAVLFQAKKEVARCKVEDTGELEQLLTKFFSYLPQPFIAFRKAIDDFKEHLPGLLTVLRNMIETAYRTNIDFKQTATIFLKQLQKTVNPNIEDADIREMLIQHVLTEEIFMQIFDNPDFHQQNNVAKQLYALEEKLFVGGSKKELLLKVSPYYATIKSTAALVSDWHEKQAFLKVIYETFYKIYNPKAADRLGVIYTPTPIVRFMIEGADWLCEKHFGKSLIDQDVEILDPSVGTGTYIVELLNHFRGQKDKLSNKYLKELHANEVAILPYYVANLNIEATYLELTKKYEEFRHLCFVDTLDNTAALRAHKGYQYEFRGGMGEENVGRIQEQNKRKISVVIGNPPYNANQRNENENNKNREYAEIDRRIKQTYIARSAARKTKLYDMFVRFLRWASDRIDDNGIVAFITNRSFIDKYNFDGYRRVVSTEFSDLHVVDLGGDYKTSGIGGGGNVFGIGTGVAISFFVRKQSKSADKPPAIRYYYPPVTSAKEKLAWLSSTNFMSLTGEQIRPDSLGYWIGQVVESQIDNLPVASKEAKAARTESQAHAIFRTFSLGVSTNRDDWLYDFEKDNLVRKVRALIAAYEKMPSTTSDFPNTLKWSRNLKRRLAQKRREAFDDSLIVQANYRPFCATWFYRSALFVDEMSITEEIFLPDRQNIVICFTDPHGQKPWLICASSRVTDLHFVGAAAGTICLPRFRYSNNEQVDNITNWALEQFIKNYGKAGNPITKDAIFDYVYGVLHDPIYREKYALNLKREFPRVPFYADFWKWADWGKKLMALHIGYESIDSWPLKRADVSDQKSRKAGLPPKVSLKADEQASQIIIDSETQLSGIPSSAWNHQLGGRSALEWVLDQYREKKPKDPIIREKFNTYRFADHKEEVIDLLKRVTRVSVETMNIANEMKKVAR